MRPFISASPEPIMITTWTNAEMTIGYMSNSTYESKITDTVTLDQHLVSKIFPQMGYFPMKIHFLLKIMANFDFQLRPFRKNGEEVRL